MRTASTETSSTTATQMDENTNQTALEASPSPIRRHRGKRALLLTLLAGIALLLVVAYLGEGGNAVGVAAAMAVAVLAATGMFSTSNSRG
jgi:hypothetical protein